MFEQAVLPLNARPPRDGKYVLYWMQAAQRIRANPALNHAIRLANALAKPLAVCFCLRSDVPGANSRHYAFMLQGLAETAGAVERLGAAFVLLIDRDPDCLAGDAAAAVTDCGYLEWQLAWRQRMAAAFACPLTQVETECAVPVDILSQKEEYAAASLRPKLHRLVGACLASPLAADRPPKLRHGIDAKTLGPPKDAVVEPSRIPALLAPPFVPNTIRPSAIFAGGEKPAWRRLKSFLADKIAAYARDGNNPDLDVCSGLSPYLHFGQISPLAIAREILSFCSDHAWPPRRRPAKGEAEAEQAAPLLAGRDVFLEQLLVRRDLAINFAVRNPAYQKYHAIPQWARRSLERHRPDPRPYLYDAAALENAATHDRYWNAAQRQMLATGHMHNYMRMYWGKKVIEWMRDPEEAFHLLSRLNDAYQLDGRDANGYAGIAWCFGKHDRPWKERPVFGQVRYMNAAGLERKFSMDAYVERHAK